MNMKTKWCMIFVMIFIASSVRAQSNAFGDDIYYSSKNKKMEAQKSKVEPVKKVNETPVVVEATVPSERNVDEYNRRYIDDKEYIDETVDKNDTIVEYVEGELTQRIIKFHNPSKVVISGTDNVNVFYDGENYELNFDEPSSSGLSVNINSGYGYNTWYTDWYPYYGYGWYSPWHYGWYSPHYYRGWYSPWYYSWYDPWYYGGWHYSGAHYHHHHYHGYYSGGYHSQYARHTRSSNNYRATRTRSSDVSTRSYSGTRGESSSRVSRGDIISSRSDRQTVTRDQSATRSTRSSALRSESNPSSDRSSASSSTPSRTRVSSANSSSSSSNSRTNSSGSRSSSSSGYNSTPSRSSGSSSGSFSSGSSRSSSGGGSYSGGGGGSTRSSGSGGGRR